MHATIASRHPARTIELGGIPVRRLLPTRGRRTVGAWCFLDHFGPADSSATMTIGPHPHIGLHTVTWLVEGEVEHRDSLGSRQVIRPGQLNLMTAGRGIAHAELGRPDAAPRLHGAQLWVAQPEATRHGDPAFAHHPSLPRLDRGGWQITVLVGAPADAPAARSDARHDTPLLGLALRSEGKAEADLALDPGHEHAVAVLGGAVAVGGETVGVGELAVLSPGADAVALRATAATDLLVLGGEPLSEDLVMWWNFVARTPEEIAEARTAWNQGDARFGPVDTDVAVVPAPALTPLRRK